MKAIKTKISAVKTKIVSFISKVDWSNVKVDTYVRYALMILSVVNMILTHFGKNPIPYSEEKIYTVLSDVFTALIMIVNTYKDNPTSKESIEYTEIQRAAKASEDLEEIQELLEAKLAELIQVNDSDDETIGEYEEDIDSSEEDIEEE